MPPAAQGGAPSPARGKFAAGADGGASDGATETVDPGSGSEVDEARQPTTMAMASKARTSATRAMNRLFKTISYFSSRGLAVLPETWLRGTDSTLRRPL